MAHFVLVHGSFHGSWCWQRLIPLLRAGGHEVTAPDFPGSGKDTAPPENADLASYATRIAGAIDEVRGPVILAGHSMGGIVASQVAEWRPHRIAATVYINGLMLRPGESLVSFLAAHAHLGVEDLVLKNMQVSPDGATASFPAAAAGEVFYNCCPPEDAAWATAQLRPQRLKIYSDPLALTPARFGSVRRFYVEGLKDNAVSLAYQRSMADYTACEEVFSLDGDHSPFLSAPQTLADRLEEVARRTV
ncbi:alpha/beta fold hydrolase [Ancylobacter pratisalsi]|uniref:Alpha/beta fold hydrolase n=1 Tax=Ancylobacter pratisalsi TaxID=1745854 RepID=A0A6P1YTF4_9HYPH|nr:alpha/beta fold hydrolase [Ancylobacter pratisalsi]QIB35353.1 alpha/beta fold hydrolase [Ancylobacter pratisalsi]